MELLYFTATFKSEMKGRGGNRVFGVNSRVHLYSFAFVLEICDCSRSVLGQHHLLKGKQWVTSFHVDMFDWTDFVDLL